MSSSESVMVGSIDERTAQGVVEINTCDPLSSLAFYQVLGFEMERRYESSFFVMRREQVRVLIAEDRKVPSGPRGVNLRIIVADVDEIWKVATEAGLRITAPIATRPYGLRDFTVEDPSGFELRFAALID